MKKHINRRSSSFIIELFDNTCRLKCVIEVCNEEGFSLTQLKCQIEPGETVLTSTLSGVDFDDKNASFMSIVMRLIVYQSRLNLLVSPAYQGDKQGFKIGCCL